METHVLAESAPDSYAPVASPWHTGLLLAVIGALAFRGSMRADQMRAVLNPDRIGIYERTMLSEWLVFAFVIVGVKLKGSALSAVVGDGWRTVNQVLRHVGMAILFLIAAITLDSVLNAHLRSDKRADTAQFLLPHGGLEIALWVALSVTAGICEEAIYRGYLQRQFMAFTKSVPAGIVFSAVAFGVAHSYQGFRQAFQIALLGVLAGILAYWCRSVRPGMIAHALQDVLGGLIRH